MDQLGLLRNLLPKSKQEFSQKDYWDSFFKKRGNKAFEWYGEYPELADHLHKYIKPKDDILIVGCGNSNLGRDLYDIGYSKIINIDISPVVIKQMLSHNDKERPGLQYLQMDALRTTFENGAFSVVLDKGTLDALMPDSEDETIKRISQYFSEVLRLLRIGGRYVCISLLQEHILKYAVDYFSSHNCMVRIVRCFDAERKAQENGESAMPVFIVICTKFKNLVKPVFEINLSSSEKMHRCETKEEVISNINTAQEAFFVCSGLKRTTIGEDSEISIALLEQGNGKARFTVYVVDVEREPTNSEYAAFIVAQGREAEWLFSTKAGRRHLVKLTKHNRLAIVTLHRDQKYGSFEDVQNELADFVCNLAPSTLKQSKILFLALGSDVGNRNIRYKGHSQISGDYVVEEIETDNNEKFRRLFYLSSQLVIQSEARLKTIKSLKSNKPAREIIDLTYLNCRHHIFMSMAAYLASEQNKNTKLAVIGLGGGGLCSFLHKFLPSTLITGIDVDEDMLKIATDWFGFKQDNRLKAKIQDGLEYLRECAEKGIKLDSVLFDVDNKDKSIGMSCPPAEFLEEHVLKQISRILGDQGLFVLNMVLRDQNLRPPLKKRLKQHFKTIICYKLEDELNEIIICTHNEMTQDHINNNLKNACDEINKFFSKNKNSDLAVDVNEFMKKLEVSV